MDSFKPSRFGSFFLLDHLGSGGMADVFLATRFESASLKDPPFLAIKRLLPHLSSKPEFVRRLTDEAKLTVLLAHPHIVQVRDLGAIGTDFFLSMEWVNGFPLDHIFRRLVERHQPLPTDLALFIIEQVADALNYAHSVRDSAGRPIDIIHRDVTPGNVLTSLEGTTKLSDFGIATVERIGPANKKQIPFGKVPYMAPELFRSDESDRRADIYSLGILLYEALTLRRPFRETHTVGLQQEILALSWDPSIFSAISDPVLRKLLEATLSKDLHERPSSAKEVLQILASKRSTAEPKNLFKDLIQNHFAEDLRTAEKRRAEAIGALEALLKQPADLSKGDLWEEDLEDANAPHPPVESTEFVPSQNKIDATRVRPKSPLESPTPSQVGRIELKRKRVERVIRPPPVVVEEVSRPENRFAPEETEVKLELDTNPVAISEPSAKISRSPKLQPEPKAAGASSSSIPWRWILAGIITLGATVLIGMNWDNLLHPSLPVIASPVHRVTLYVTIEGEPSSSDQVMTSSWADGSARESQWLRPVSSFFADEFLRHTGKKGTPVTLEVITAKRGAPPAEWKGTLFRKWLVFDRFASLLGLPAEEARPGLARIFVHGYSKRYDESPRYPLDYPGDRPPHQGIVFLPLTERDYGDSLVRLAHEVGHMLGGTDKSDSNGHPHFPDGFTDPTRKPPYPQTYGELMARAIPRAVDSVLPIERLNQARIGLKTAREFGWIP